ncbi:hypothetical protein P9112_000962 [Eukaryota sp. TZLM1-RC]
MYIASLFHELHFDSCCAREDTTGSIRLTPSSLEPSCSLREIPSQFEHGSTAPFSESLQIAFRHAVFKDYRKVLAFIERTMIVSFNAFLNTNGGLLFIGINHEGVVEGVTMDHRLRDDVRCLLSSIAVSTFPRLLRHHSCLRLVPVKGKQDCFLIILAICYNRTNDVYNGRLFLSQIGKSFIRSTDRAIDSQPVHFNEVVNLPPIKTSPLSSEEVSAVVDISVNESRESLGLMEVKNEDYRSQTKMILSTNTLEQLRKFRLVTIKGNGKTVDFVKLITSQQQRENKRSKILILKTNDLWCLQSATYLSQSTGLSIGQDVGLLTGNLTLNCDSCRIVYATYHSFINLVNHESFLSFDHVILDDFHYYTQTIIIAIALLKYLIKSHLHLKIVIAGDYIDELILGYFNLDHGSINLPERRFKPSILHFEDYQPLVNDLLDFTMQFKLDTPSLKTDSLLEITKLIINDCLKTAKVTHGQSLIVFVSHGMVSCFLTELRSFLTPKYSHLNILPLTHDSTINQIRQATRINQSNNVNIIIATSAVEGLFFHNMAVVIDTCLHTVHKFDVQTNSEHCFKSFSTKSMVNLRSNRVSVSNGTVYRLVNKAQDEGFPENSPDFNESFELDRLVLKILLNFDLNPIDFLTQIPMIPDVSIINHSINNLLQSNCVVESGQGKSGNFNLTSFGKFAAVLNVSAEIARFLLMSYLFGILQESLVIVSLMEYRIPRFSQPIKSFYQMIEQSGGFRSDHIAHLNMYNYYVDCFNQFNSIHEELNWVKENSFITWEGLKSIDKRAFFLKLGLSKLKMIERPSSAHQRRVMMSRDHYELVFDPDYKSPSDKSDFSQYNTKPTLLSKSKSLYLLGLMGFCFASNLFILRPQPSATNVYSLLKGQGYDTYNGVVLSSMLQNNEGLGSFLVDSNCCEKSAIIPINSSSSSFLSLISSKKFNNQFKIELTPSNAYSDNVQRVFRFPCLLSKFSSQSVTEPYLPCRELLLPPDGVIPTIPVSLMRSFAKFSLSNSSLSVPFGIPMNSSANVRSEGVCGVSSKIYFGGAGSEDDEPSIYSVLSSLFPCNWNMPQVVLLMLGADEVEVADKGSCNFEVKAKVSSMVHSRSFSDPLKSITRIMNLRQQFLAFQFYFCDQLFSSNATSSDNIKLTCPKTLRRLSKKLKKDFIGVLSANSIKHQTNSNNVSSFISKNSLKKLNNLKLQFKKNENLIKIIMIQWTQQKKKQ